jgi:hypothetical protein
MRISPLLRCLPLLLALTSPALLRAQFQQPTDEELKMTSDPKAPGAAAVVLDYEEITNDPQHYYSVYARIKVLQEKAKDLATVEIRYLQGNVKIADIKARTIHSDGTIIPLVVKPEDLLLTKATTKEGYQWQTYLKVFNLPSVEVGSILEFRYEVRYDEYHTSTPFWEIQGTYFVHKAHYSFTPFKRFLWGYQYATGRYMMDKHGDKLDTLIWTGFLPPGAEVKSDTVGSLTVDLSDVPPAPKEDWMPPEESTRYRVLFYFKSAKTPAAFWESETKYWSKDVDHFAESPESIQNAVAALIAPGDSDLDKAKKLYKVVQALDNTDFSRKKSYSELKQLKLKEAKHAEETWVQRSGSSEDIALLYLAMLRAAGLTAYDMKVSDRSKRVFDPGYLNFGQLDGDLIDVNIAGKEVLLDPGEKMCPFQTLHWKHSMSTGIRQGTGNSGFAVTAQLVYTDNKTIRAGDITLDENGAITGRLNFVMTGQEALYWRQTALRNDPDELKKQFDRQLESITPEGVEAHVDHFVGLDDSEASLMAAVDLHGSLGTATAKRLLLPAFFFETRSDDHPFVAQEKRTQPVDMHYPGQVLDKIAYHLPANLNVEGAPQDSRIAWEGHVVLNVKSVSAPGQITISRLLSRAFTTAKPEEYQDLRGFYQKVAAADQAQLVLSKSPAVPAPAPPAPKGN